MFTWQTMQTDRPLVIAHRGGAEIGRENAAATVRAALNAGADAVEIDVRFTADREPVCFHDADLTRLAGIERSVGDLNLSELKHHVPYLMTLNEAISCSQGSGLLLDVKTLSEDNLPAILQAVAQDKNRCMLGLRSIALTKAARSLDPDVSILGFLSDPASAPQARHSGATWFRLWQADANATRVAAVQGAGLRCAVMVGQPRSVPEPGWPPFPVGRIDHAGLCTVLASGPDAILLDNPRLLQPAIPRSCHSSVA
jgi:glycerophosphoryl diester phosphodiesterase